MDPTSTTPLMEANEKDAKSRIQEWYARLKFYSQLASIPSYEKFAEWQNWQERSHYINKVESLKLTLEALKELQQTENKDGVTLLRSKIDILLAELEYNQLALITKWQHLNPEKAIQFRQELKDKKHHFHHQLANLNIEKNETLANYNNFISKEKKQFGFYKKSIVANENVAIGIETTNRFISFLSGIGHGLQVLGRVFSTIPIISAITTSISLIQSAAKSWFKNKSKQKKILSTVLAAVGIGIVISAGLATAATGGLVAGLITIGVVKNNLLPFIKVRREMKLIQNELDTLQSRKTRTAPIHDLVRMEKNLLLTELEKHYVAAPENKRDEINKAISLVAVGKDIAAIRSNAEVQAALKPRTLEHFLAEKNSVATQYLTNHLSELKQKESKKRWEFVNGLLGIAGAILVCIPTPPTVIIGASFLVVNSAVDITMRYDLISRFKQFVFGTKPVTESKTNSTTESPEPTIKPTLSAGLKPHNSTADVELQLYHGHTDEAIEAIKSHQNDEQFAQRVAQVKTIAPKPVLTPDVKDDDEDGDSEGDILHGPKV